MAIADLSSTSRDFRPVPRIDFPFAKLTSADLIVDANYEGGHAGNAGDDSLGRLLPVGNQGGFRYSGSPRTGTKLVALKTSGADPDWPDSLEQETGRFTYFGDNKTPGRELHDTQRGGNDLLRQTFGWVHGAPEKRRLVPPFLVFGRGEAGRDVKFLGLAAPGGPNVTPRDDLVAVWKTLGDQRFQNYRATFTILNEQVVSRTWIGEILAGNELGADCPPAWRAWVETGVYRPLAAERIRHWRTKAEQLPATSESKAVLRAVDDHFRPDPIGFEPCAARLLADAGSAGQPVRPNATKPRWRTRCYRLLHPRPTPDSIELDFALEAKCYAATTPVGVEAQSRLISRIRPRQFGVLVTTSYVAGQAYRDCATIATP